MKHQYYTLTLFFSLGIFATLSAQTCPKVSVAKPETTLSHQNSGDLLSVDVSNPEGHFFGLYVRSKASGEVLDYYYSNETHQIFSLGKQVNETYILEVRGSGSEHNVCFLEEFDALSIEYIQQDDTQDVSSR